MNIKNPIEKFGLVTPAVYPTFKKFVKNKKKIDELKFDGLPIRPPRLSGIPAQSDREFCSFKLAECKDAASP
jgi:hypothetical protein